MGRRKVVADQPVEVFTEVEPATTKGRKRKPTLVFTDDGNIDWSGVPDGQKVDVLAAIAADTDISETLKAMGNDVSSDESLLITDEHIEFLLDAIEAAQRFLIPRMVARKSVMGLPPGQFQIHPRVAQQAFKFKTRDKIVPHGVKAANANLPIWAKRLIAKVGPGTKFIGLVLQDLRAQQITAIELQIKMIQEHQRNHHNNQAGKQASHPPARERAAAENTQPEVTFDAAATHEEQIA